MTDLNRTIEAELLSLGAERVGFGSLDELPDEERAGLPIGISVMVAYPPEVIRSIAELPSQQYCDWYDSLNERLDMLVTRGAEMLRELGYQAVAQTREHVGSGEEENSTILPHKTVARLAGIGWIGRCALLITKDHGSAVRLSSILTDAPLTPARPVTGSYCGTCQACRDACPAGALHGKNWAPGVERDELVDAVACRTVARERAAQGFGGVGITICGKCIEVCPHTRRYLYSSPASS